MSALNPDTIVLGSEYVKPKTRMTFSFAEQAAGGLYSGRKACVLQKMDGNEDAMGYVRIPGGGVLMLIADSHFGAMAANLAVSGFLSLFRETTGSVSFRLFSCHYMLDQAIREKKNRENSYRGCATTLISVYVLDKTAYFCSTGDSYFYLHRGGWLKRKNDIQQGLFVGDPYQNLHEIRSILTSLRCVDRAAEPETIARVAFVLSQIQQEVRAGRIDRNWIDQLSKSISRITGLPFPVNIEDLLVAHHPLNLQLERGSPSWGAVDLQDGDCLFLATDGIDEELSGCPLKEVGATLGETSAPLEKAGKLLKKCATRKGGGDNLMFILLQR